MGVDRSDYLVYGWKMPYEVDDQLSEEYWDDVNEYDINFIADGMSGKYIVFGSVIASADDPSEGWGFVELDNLKPTFAPEIFGEFGEVFGKYSEKSLADILKTYNIPETPKLLLFSHYS